MNYSKSKPVIFGLYGEKEFLLPDFIHCETIEYRSAKSDWVIKPHLHVNLFQVFILVGGTIDFMVENNITEVSSPSIVTIPENTLHSLQLSKDVRGMVLTVSSSFLETFFKSSPNVLIKLATALILNDVSNKLLFQLVKQMINGLYEELQGDLPEKGLMLQTHVSFLIGSIYRLALEKSAKAVSADNRSAQYFRAFYGSVKQCHTVKKTVIDYARELNITPVHLNRVCQSAINKSALQVVHDFLIVEAGKYLKFTDYSVSEIAYRLNFDDPAYFSRFFHKKTGTSPTEFRGGYKS